MLGAADSGRIGRHSEIAGKELNRPGVRFWEGCPSSAPVRQPVAGAEWLPGENSHIAWNCLQARDDHRETVALTRSGRITRHSERAGKVARRRLVSRNTPGSDDVSPGLKHPQFPRLCSCSQE